MGMGVGSIDDLSADSEDGAAVVDAGTDVAEESAIIGAIDDSRGTVAASAAVEVVVVVSGAGAGAGSGIDDGIGNGVEIVEATGADRTDSGTAPEEDPAKEDDSGMTTGATTPAAAAAGSEAVDEWVVVVELDMFVDG